MVSTSRAVDDSESAPTLRASYLDVLDASAHCVAEIVDGTLHPHPQPAMPLHGQAPRSV